jgi:DNA-binding transcriptional LysR family regulator
MLERLFASVGGQPRIAGEHDSVTSLIAAVESGRGIALALECLECMTGGRLKFIPLQQPPPPIPVGAVWREDAETELLKQFVAAARPGG